MATIQNIKNIQTENVPGNCGYLVHNTKRFGNAPVDNPNKVVLVNPTTREIHTWSRNCYNRWQLGDHEMCNHAWEKNSDAKNRKFQASHRMLVCPIEQMNNGVCPKRYDSEHRFYFYHFTKVVNRRVIRKNRKPVCRYSLTDPKMLCWEGTNSKHVHMYEHQ